MNAGNPIYEVFNANIVAACHAYHTAYLENREAQEPPAYGYWLKYISDPRRQNTAPPTLNAQNNTVTLSTEAFNALVACNGTTATATAINHPRHWERHDRPCNYNGPLPWDKGNQGKPRYWKNDHRPYGKGRGIEQDVPEYHRNRGDRRNRGGRAQENSAKGAYSSLATSSAAVAINPDIDMLVAEGIRAGLPMGQVGISALDLRKMLGDLPDMEGGEIPSTPISEPGTDWNVQTGPASPAMTATTMTVDERMVLAEELGRLQGATSKQAGTATPMGLIEPETTEGNAGTKGGKGKAKAIKMKRPSVNGTSEGASSEVAREGEC
ncbi:hypothetical protein FRC10_002578 [Ceratobasidium sp. 414]|nr:hypothetical protein FRC10_002578 [Ceratobasidium sp. 414]